MPGYLTLESAAYKTRVNKLRTSSAEKVRRMAEGMPRDIESALWHGGGGSDGGVGGGGGGSGAGLWHSGTDVPALAANVARFAGGSLPEVAGGYMNVQTYVEVAGGYVYAPHVLMNDGTYHSRSG